MLLDLEDPPLEGAGHIEGGVAVFEPAVAERDDDLALGHVITVEVGDPLIPLGISARVAHERPPNSGARVSANSSTAPMSWSPSLSSSATDSEIIPRFASHTPRASTSK